MTHNLQQRFPLDAFAILSLLSIHFKSVDEIAGYGDKEFETLLSHYGSDEETTLEKRFQQ